jgi:hypothetical protein
MAVNLGEVGGQDNTCHLAKIAADLFRFFLGSNFFAELWCHVFSKQRAESS